MNSQTIDAKSGLMTCACGKELHMRRFVGGEIQCKQCCRRYDSRGYQLAAPPPPTVALPDFSQRKPTRFVQRGKRIPHEMTKEEATEIYLNTPIKPGRQTDAFRQARQLLMDLKEKKVLAKRKVNRGGKLVPWTPKDLPGFELVPETTPKSMEDAAQPGIPEMPQLQNITPQEVMNLIMPEAPVSPMNFCPHCGLRLAKMQKDYEIEMQDAHV